MNPATTWPAAPLGRRLGAALYDLMVVVGLLMAATALALIPSGGKAVPAHTWWFQMYLLLWLLGYFGYSWRVGGQTIGMRAWKLSLLQIDGSRLDWRLSARRLAAALLGGAALGAHFWWCLIDAERQSLADRLCGTRMLWRPG